MRGSICEIPTLLSTPRFSGLIRDQLLLVDVDALYEPASGGLDFAKRRIEPMALPALEKLYSNGWEILYWTSRPRKQFTGILNELFRRNALLLTTPCSDDALLMRCPRLAESAETTKLTLLETIFSEHLDEGREIFMIESDIFTASVLRMYGSKAKINLLVHTAPLVWIQILALTPEELQPFMRKKLGGSNENRSLSHNSL